VRRGGASRLGGGLCPHADCLYGVWGVACGGQLGSVVAAAVAHGVGVGEVGGTCQRMCWSGHTCRGAPCLRESPGAPIAWPKAEAARR
jgi:hypothetical protein